MRSIMIRIAALAALVAAAGCNTVGGFGEDVEAGGEAISDTAQDVERDIEN